MRGMLKSKSPGAQLLLVISIALVSFFIIGLVGLFIISAITGMGITEMSDMGSWDLTKPSSITAIRGMQVVQFISLFLVPVFICTRLFSTDSRSYLGLRRPLNPGYFGIGIMLMLIALPFVNWMGELNKNMVFPPDIDAWLKAKETEAARTIQALLGQRTVKDLVINIICIAGLAAVGEELLFRGLLQRIFIKLFKSPWLGIIVAAFLFSAMHLQFYGFLPRFILGVLLGLMFWYSGSLWVPMLAHFVYDALLITLAYFYPSMLKDESTVKLANLALTGTISLVLLVMLVTWMVKRSTVSYREVYADDAIPVKDHPF